MVSMDAYDAMSAILDCNEMIDKLRSANADNIPDMNKIKLSNLLSDYRDLLIKEMRRSPLEVFKTNNGN